MASKEELACVYSALILMDDDVTISGDKITTLLKAANVEVEPYWPDLFARSLEGVSLKELISSFGSAAPAAAPAAAAPAAAAPAAKAEEPAKGKKEEKKKEEEEEDDDIGLSLFD
ncbi:60S acidic ribosomal protein P1-like [Paramacrobiotus metropolitanus]|uniref:60S acidic ribosomal protein P1-like n=1 Tax=Paramacrobiotus metropolitanus TaxID=2943436 RepID=UPI0024463A56|nr:60S acidic ribosomal protein P1-like [Paramacrobiotus metropolitanus]